jgi:uncharacterized protein (DUF302 family)
MKKFTISIDYLVAEKENLEKVKKAIENNGYKVLKVYKNSSGAHADVELKEGE